MKKAFDQTVREIKREVNKKVLKVPGVEQKVLDATSNEPWGPHGLLLAEISQATRNYHDYQLIMTVIWKRLNDTGKNWRHVYKALIVLEYLVAHGSERVIDEIREHAYQISTLSNFQYIDSSGRDQGSNVRKKSQCLVVLVNDKERIQEVRQKAAANRDKFRSASLGGMYRPSSYYSTGGYGDRYDDDRYGGRHGYRDDDWNGYGRERERGYRDDDHYGRYGESYGHDGDRYGRDSGERYSRDGYREDDYWGRSQSSDDYRHGSIRSSDKERDHAYEDDGKNSLRGNGTRADDHSQDERNVSLPSTSSSARRHERKLSEQNLGAPPSYEEAVGEAQYPVHGERNGETSAASPPRMSPPTSTSLSHASFAPSTSAAPASAAAFASPKKEADGFNEFDPQSQFSAPAATSNGAEVDLLGSLSEPFSSDQLAIVPVASGPTASDVNLSAADVSNGSTFAATAIGSPVTNQPFEDPFGDGPFRALSAIDGDPTQSPSNASFHPSTNQRSELPQPIAQTLSSQNTDILADILPPSGSSPLVGSQTGFPTQDGQPTSFSGFPAQAPQSAPMTVFAAQASQPAPQMNFPSLTGQPTTHSDFPAQIGDQSQTDFLAQAGHPAISQTGYLGQANQPAPLTAFSAQTIQPGSLTGFSGQSSPHFYGNFLQQQGSTASHFAYQSNGGSTTQYHTANFLPLTSPAAPIASQIAPQTPVGPPTQNNAMSYQPPLPPSTGSLVTVPQPAKEKFEPKSAVWADTLNRGLVNLNISGPKTNPLADIGVDFEAMNRKEKRMEKPTTATVTSTVTMGKAMGSGSGIGRAGAGALRPPPNPMMGPGIGMGGYGGVNQPMGMGMGMGMGMNMGIEQGSQMPPYGFPPGSAMPGGYNPTMGSSSFASQQPFGGGYR